MKYELNGMCKILVAAAAISAAAVGAYAYANRTVLTCHEETITEYRNILGKVASNKYKAAMEAERTTGTLSESWMRLYEQDQKIYERVRQELIDCGAKGNMLTPTYISKEK